MSSVVLIPQFPKIRLHIALRVSKSPRQSSVANLNENGINTPIETFSELEIFISLVMMTILKAWKRLRVFLLLLAFLICQICLFVFPAHAFTSLNNCVANSACAVTLANELGLKTAVKDAVVTSSPRLISVSGAITKSAVAEVTYGTGTLAFFTGAAVSYAYLSWS